MMRYTTKLIVYTLGTTKGRGSLCDHKPQGVAQQAARRGREQGVRGGSFYMYITPRDFLGEIPRPTESPKGDAAKLLKRKSPKASLEATTGIEIWYLGYGYLGLLRIEGILTE